MLGLLLANIPFLHPGLAGAALLTGLIPVLIHLINRRRYRRVPWAAMSFLLAASRRSARRMRLEQWLLMLARIAVIVLLGLAVARPYMPASAIIPADFSRVHRILVVDNSLSMSAKDEAGRTRFSAAKQCAAQLVASFPSGDAVSLVTMSAPAEAVIAQPAYDRRWVRESVSSLPETQATTDVPGAVREVLRILRETVMPQGSRVVYVVSDFTRHDWETADLHSPPESVRALRQLADALPDPENDLHLIRIDSDSNDNLAVTRLEPESALVGLNTRVRVIAEVANFASTTARGATLQVRRDGLIVRREQLAPIEPGESVVTTITTEFPIAGTHAIEARVAAGGANSLSADDARYLSVESCAERAVLLVDGRPGMKALDGQAGFLATALAPGAEGAESGSSRDLIKSRPEGGDLFFSKVVDETTFESEILSNYDAVALCNVARITPSSWDRLRRFVARGGGVMFALGELVSPEHYNRSASASGSDLLPGKLGRPLIRDLQLENPQAGSRPLDPELGFKLGPQPPGWLADFAGLSDSGLFRAKVTGYVPFELESVRGETVLSFTDGAPALISSTYGNGRVLIWTTTVNMDWTNLPAKGDFVSLMHNAFAYLVPQRGAHRNVRVGDSIHEVLTPAESSMALRVTEDDGTVHEPTLASRDESLALVFGPIDRAQLLTLAVGTQSRAVAANVDPAESDLAILAGSDLAASLGRPVRVLSDRELSAAQTGIARSTELAAFSLYAVLALLFLELWMAMRFGAPRDSVALSPIERGPISPGAVEEEGS